MGTKKGKVKKLTDDTYPKYSKVKILDDWMDWFIQYNKLWQLNHAKIISPEQSKQFKSFTGTFDDVHKFIVSTLCKRMHDGDKKPISIILTALGANALKNHWFVESLAHLLEKGKCVSLHVPKNKKSTDLLKKMRRFEKKLITKKSMIEASSFFNEPPQTLKTNYYRDLDNEILIIILRYTFLFLYPSKFTLSREILFH